ncbi:HAMP domain-containing protein [Cohnella sp. CFH 77786]|uniref:sensor histidine kinase n=1 Tax=Cohnella sp. CFH 77786 TaxID=2662265 RepID=UPI001C60C139|nr:histidine kinase [Cohnella sp. CFH 77786]MBW5445334.1 HAMP domain-containing protein [Cohnella sp. CFH 77786]
MKALLNAIRDSRLHTKLLITYLLLLAVTVLILSFSDYRLSRDTVLEMAKKDVYTIVRKNDEILDAKFSRIREMIYGFTEDADFYETFSKLHPADKTEVLAADLRIKGILDKYFAQSQDLYSVQVATSYFIFGTASSANSEHSKNFIPMKGFNDTELSRIARQGAGKTRWVPTYDFSDMFRVPYLKQMDYDYKYLFSAVTMIQGSYFKGTFRSYSDMQDKPVLILNFKDSLFTGVFAGSIPVSGSTYFVVDEKGRIVSHPDRSSLTKTINLPELGDMMNEKYGVRMLKIGGKEQAVAFSRSDITGWLSLAVIPPQELLGPVIRQYIRNMLISAGIITLLFVGLSFFLSRLVTQPFRTMIRAIVNAGEGRFETRFRESGSYEFRVLMKKFNDMNENIRKLFQENYETRIREKEAEIKALNLQLDPHFMYNTLNMVSLMSLEKGEYEISEIVVSLSNMLKYMVKTEASVVRFRDDLAYLEGYVTIMCKRLEGSVRVEYEIDSRLLEEGVPKFFLQPIVENAFVHGFKRQKKEGVLRIACRLEGDARVFRIEDNGQGMETSQTEELLQSERHVGLSNVNRRIRILYGDPYGLQIRSVPGEGTAVTVTLPSSASGESLTPSNSLSGESLTPSNSRL